MKKVLVVDDDLAIRSMLADFLEEDGHSVTTAASGEKALELCEKNDYDIVFTDCEMEAMSGVQLAENLVQRLPKAPRIILMTGSSITKAEAGRSISRIIRKPCGLAPFLDEIKQV